jgi:hypothetical protein
MNPKRASPASKEELINFLQTDPNIDRNLEFMGIDRGQYENFWTSENDGEEFTVLWGQKVTSFEGVGIPIVFEKSGADGVRQVGLTNGTILDVSDDAKYDRLLKGKIDKADAGQRETGLVREKP